MTITFRLLAPILVGLVLAIGALTLISVNSQQTLIAGSEETQLSQAFDGFFAQASDQERLAQSLATGASNLPEAGSAFYWQDAQGLLAQVTPYYKELDNAYGISELNFYIAPATVFLRVTDPLHRGDDASGYRKIAVQTI